MPKNTIVQVWKDNSVLNDGTKWTDYVKKITGNGYRVILSACWFLNIIRYGSDWNDFYNCDPSDFQGLRFSGFGVGIFKIFCFLGSEEQKRMVIGG